jgi:hypothetical protein
MTIGQESITLIVDEETGGESYYNATERHPDWPGGASGVTIGCGYDCGYSTPEQISSDWGGVLSPAMVEALQSVAGIHGSPARSHAAGLRGIVNVPWEAALQVFLNKDVPKWTATVERALPNTDKLPPDCLGVIVSIAFNRGASFSLEGDRYTEMRNIKADMEALNFAGIPAQIRAMKRLWPLGTSGHADLTARREHEAVLFEKALAANTPVSVTELAQPVAPADGRGDIAWVQRSINTLFHLTLTVDDQTGAKTENAIRAFQLTHDIGVDGQAGPETIAAIEVALAKVSA